VSRLITTERLPTLKALERPQPGASVIQIAVLLGKAEAQQILAMPSSEER